jgi:large subunit ribosomal protein L29
MAFPKIADARKLSDAEIAEAIVEAKRKLFQLRLEKATGRLQKPHEFKHTKHWVAQLLTVETERKKAARSDSTSTTNNQTQEEE